MPVAEYSGKIFSSGYYSRLSIQFKDNYEYAKKHQGFGRSLLWTGAGLGSVALFRITNQRLPGLACILCTLLGIYHLAQDRNKAVNLEKVSNVLELLRRIDDLFEFRFEGGIGSVNATYQLQLLHQLQNKWSSIAFDIKLSSIGEESARSFFAQNLIKIVSLVDEKLTDLSFVNDSSLDEESAEQLNEIWIKNSKAFQEDYINFLYSQTQLPHVEYDRFPTPTTVRIELSTISKVQRVWKIVCKVMLQCIAGMLVTLTALKAMAWVHGEDVVAFLLNNHHNGLPHAVLGSWIGLLGSIIIIKTTHDDLIQDLKPFNWTTDWLAYLPTDIPTTRVRADAIFQGYKTAQNANLFKYSEWLAPQSADHSIPQQLDAIEKVQHNTADYISKIQVLVCKQSRYNTAVLHAIRSQAGLPNYPDSWKKAHLYFQIKYWLYLN